MPPDTNHDELAAFRAENERLHKVQRVLMDRVEATMVDAGSTLGLQQVASTLTEQLNQQRDRLIEAAERARIASDAKSAFLANMSHEIRTPMTAILGYADILATDEESVRDPAQIERAVRTIRANAEHLLTIINDILDVSKLESGRMEVDREAVDAWSVVSEVVATLTPRAERKGLHLGVKCASPIPERIDTDPARLRQIMLNLVGNAMKFTHAGAVDVRISYDAATSKLVISVADTGVGMSAEELARVRRCEAFTQADASSTRRYGGTGMGLHISRALAELMGGGLEVDSALGRGTTITVRLDAGDRKDSPMISPSLEIETSQEQPEREAAPEPSRVGPARRADAPLNGRRILVVEDGPDNQRLIRHMLIKAGAEVELAENGLEGLEAVNNESAERPFDLILMDMQMPELDGYAATRQLRGREWRRPIIALTAHAMSDDRQKCLDAGCDDYMTKPINREHLIAVCRKWADANASVRAAA